jgi:hypothetical protein
VDDASRDETSVIASGFPHTKVFVHERNKGYGGNQMLAQIIWQGHTIAEVSCPTKYFTEASSINLRRSIRYGFGCFWTALNFRLARMGIIRSKLFPVNP